MRWLPLVAVLGLGLVGCGPAFTTASNAAFSDDSGTDGQAVGEDAMPAADDGGARHDGGDGSKLEAHQEAAPDHVSPEVGDGGSEAATPDAAPDAAPDASSCPCTGDLSGIGLGDFTISFTIQTPSTTPMAILSQRASCDQSKPYWDVYTGTNGAFSQSEGVVYIEVGDGTNVFDDVSTQKVVNDDQPHHVVIKRTQGGTYFTLTVDGVGSPQGIAPLDPLTGSLPALSTGTDVCSSNGPIAGTLTDVCIQ